MTTEQEVALVVVTTLRAEADMNSEPVWLASRERVHEIIEETVSARGLDTGNWRTFVDVTVEYAERFLNLRPGWWH